MLQMVLLDVAEVNQTGGPSPAPPPVGKPRGSALP
jgi:hypothetical protein